MSRGTTQRSVRVADRLWAEAQEVADRDGESLSEVIRRALRHYVEEARS